MNWYALYTKPNCEEKVSVLLAKKGLETFFPLNRSEKGTRRKRKMVVIPLFNSIVFVRISPEQLKPVTRTENVLSVLYWKNDPAIICNDDIVILKRLSETGASICVEKTKIMEETEPESGMIRTNGNSGRRTLIVKNRMVKIDITSMGVVLSVRTSRESILERDVFFTTPELSLQ